MVAQDTGSAITGPARADLYWGGGPVAGKIAGRIKEQGRFAMLVPRTLDPAEAAKHLPLPQPKPPIEVAQHSGKLADTVKAERSIPLSARFRRRQ
jgi:membrane-bound lytic murein transglycosylase A